MRRFTVVAALAAGLALGCTSSEPLEAGADADLAGEPDAGGELSTDAGPDAGQPDAAPGDSTTVEAITFNWPARYGPSPGVDVEDERLWAALRQRASVIALQEAGWIAGYLRRQGWEVYRPNPPGDGDDQPVGNFIIWDPAVWEKLETGSHPLSPRTKIQEEAAGPTYHRPKYVIWARLRHRADGSEWVAGSVHFVPSKHLGGAALELWKLQRDSLIEWWTAQADSVLVMGDFNGQPGDAAAQPFWEVAKVQTRPSHGKRKIDWILRKPAVAGEGVTALDNRGQSDHRPIRGVLRWSR